MDPLEECLPAPGSSLPSPSRFLRQRYILALSLIALLLVASQVFIQATVARDMDDSRVVNIAGRQRMLSQKMSKLALEIVETARLGAAAGRAGLASGAAGGGAPASAAEIVSAAETASAAETSILLKTLASELGSTADLWERSNAGLLHGDAGLGLKGRNSAAVLALFERIERPYGAMLEGVRALAARAAGEGPAEAELRILAAPVLANEGAFLQGMNEITFEYDAESAARVRAIRILELLLFLVTLLTIGAEALFIFVPANRQIDAYFGQMNRAMVLLEERAISDGMTGLYNKRTGLFLLEREMHKARRRQSPLTVCFLDLDGLKELNDSRGHEAGDRLIKDFAEAIKRSVRSGDAAFRFGGDEFVLILACDRDTARAVVGRLRATARTDAAGCQDEEIAFSCGLRAFVPDACESAEEFIGLADELMYEDKRARKGRDCAS